MTSEENRQHLLYVAWAFPPARNAGMYRALATANAFVREGWNVTVLTATEDTYERLTGSDPETVNSIDPRISVVRIPFDPERGDTNIGSWSRLRVYSPLLWNASRWLVSLAQFPELAYGSWRKPLERAAEKIHEATPVDLVLGTANPNVDFAAANHLNRRFGIPFVIDHRDAWHLNVYSGKRVGKRWHRSNRLERSLLARCTEAWFVNKPIEQWHSTEYPHAADKFHVVANGYDTSFVGDTSSARPEGSPLVFGYLGTIYGPIPLREALEGWALARARVPQLENAKLVIRGRLGHFAEADQEAANLLKSFEGDNVSYGGPVSKTQVSATYQDFDALLLVISKSRYVTSGKVFEYASTGLPIAALHDPITAATGILEGYPSVHSATAVGAEEFAAAIESAAIAATNSTAETRAAARTWAAHLERDAQLAPRISALRETIESGRQ
ncbi:glycosyltransferase [Salinibacterium sp. M195]|uniref:glycosyltransferase n=1 Tax=Salinibacterium sp. M195 TaxID=2583374 RepID=UPI001C62CF31|nr:glycosyltransferase [Salinibacterium sp. M195]QYH35606.1 glycosyltransferase family 4 protein [Salinibacterium sp. M195]